VIEGAFLSELVWCTECERLISQCECPAEATSDVRRFDHLVHVICLAAEVEFKKEPNSSSEEFALRVQELLRELRDNLGKAMRRADTIDLLEREIERLRRKCGE
jgi:hypothetical protein